MRLGLFGGTFDPPHIAHLILAAEAADWLLLDRVLWVLTPNPPHKQRPDILSTQQRIALVEAAINGDTRFELSTLEFNRPAPQYAVDTVNSAIAANPQAEIYYLMGGDSLRDLPTWHNPKGFIKSCTGICVMRRPDDEIEMTKLERELPGLTAKVCILSVPLIDISSSDIRNRILARRPYRYFLPDPVHKLIVTKRLYLN